MILDSLIRYRRRSLIILSNFIIANQIIFLISYISAAILAMQGAEHKKRRNEQSRIVPGLKIPKPIPHFLSSHHGHAPSTSLTPKTRAGEQEIE